LDELFKCRNSSLSVTGNCDEVQNQGNENLPPEFRPVLVATRDLQFSIEDFSTLELRILNCCFITSNRKFMFVHSKLIDFFSFKINLVCLNGGMTAIFFATFTRL
jgi:hypothetical protein